MVTNPPIQKSMDELLVECEVAADVIAQYFAFCAQELADEKDAKSPNPDKIDALERQITELRQERMRVGTENLAIIHKALYVYAPYLKQRLAL